MFGTTNTGMTGIQFQNTSVNFTLQSTPDFADYPYRGQFANSGITAQAYAEIVYSSTQASSGYYASFCQTYDGGVYLYARDNVGTQTIPTIAVGTASFSLTIDNNVTQNSQNPVSSGGVYNAIRELYSTWVLIGTFTSFYDTTKTITLTESYLNYPFIYVKANGGSLQHWVRIRTADLNTTTWVGSRALSGSDNTREVKVKAIANTTTQISLNCYGCSVYEIRGAFV